jgi:hypothetical protein
VSWVQFPHVAKLLKKGAVGEGARNTFARKKDLKTKIIYIPAIV